MRRKSVIRVLGLSLATVLAGAWIVPASAQQGKKPAEKKEQPAGDDLLAGADDLDLMEGVEVEKLVVEALKSETTVQEAPAIITVLTGEQIRQQGYRLAADAIGMVPGYLRQLWYYGPLKTASPRGFVGGGLPMVDGLDLMDPVQGLPVMGETVPMETIQRIELISGPGGVLWGANSLMGVTNVVTMTADDLEGVEAGVGGGGGRGRPAAFKAYAMGGAKLWGDRVKLFAHASYETFFAATTTYPFNSSVARYSSPYPQGPMNATGPVTSDTNRQHIVILSGNAQLGPISAYWHLVPVIEMSFPANFMGGVMRKDLGEDSIDCTNPANKAACLLRVDPTRVGRNFGGQYSNQYGFLRYQGRFFEDKLRLDARAFYINSNINMEPYVSLVPTSLFPSGVVVNQSFNAHRAGGSVDADLALPWDLRLLFGGELFYDEIDESRADFLTEKIWIDLRLPYVCPPDQDGKRCPLISIFNASRITSGAFVDLQKKVLPNLALEVGARVQGSFGERSLDPVFLLSGGAVWGFLPNWNLKVNYAEGYRPMTLLRTDANGESIQFAGNADLVPETSRAVQGEINAVLLKGHKAIRQIAFRTDYSYTWIDNMILIQGGAYQNTSDLGIHSVEFLAELALKKGHWFAFGYTFLDISDSTRGKIRSFPNQWFTAQLLLNLWNKQLYLSSNLQVRGSAEDPNKYPALQDAPQYLGAVDDKGNPIQEPTFKVRATDIVLDRQHPLALWNAGLRFLLPKQGLSFNFDVYNILDGDFWDTEQGYDPSAYLEGIPMPMEGISFFGSLRYTYN